MEMDSSAVGSSRNENTDGKREEPGFKVSCTDDSVAKIWNAVSNSVEDLETFVNNQLSLVSLILSDFNSELLDIGDGVESFLSKVRKWQEQFNYKELKTGLELLKTNVEKCKLDIQRNIIKHVHCEVSLSCSVGREPSGRGTKLVQKEGQMPEQSNTLAHIAKPSTTIRAGSALHLAGDTSVIVSTVTPELQDVAASPPAAVPAKSTLGEGIITGRRGRPPVTKSVVLAANPKSGTSNDEAMLPHGFSLPKPKPAPLEDSKQNFEQATADTRLSSGRQPKSINIDRKATCYSFLPGNLMEACHDLIKELLSYKHNEIAYPFYQPVAKLYPELLDYTQKIPKPMDLGTVKAKMEAGEYKDYLDFTTDVRQIFFNCNLYNPPGHGLIVLCNELHHVFEKESAKIERRVQNGEFGFGDPNFYPLNFLCESQSLLAANVDPEAIDPTGNETNGSGAGTKRKRVSNNGKMTGRTNASKKFADTSNSMGIIIKNVTTLAPGHIGNIDSDSTAVFPGSMPTSTATPTPGNIGLYGSTITTRQRPVRKISRRILPDM